MILVSSTSGYNQASYVTTEIQAKAAVNHRITNTYK